MYSRGNLKFQPLTDKFQTDPKRDDIDRAIKALETGLSDAGYQKA
jgi:hypothetical protein